MTETENPENTSVSKNAPVHGRHLFTAALACLRDLRKDTRGGAAILAAILFPVVVGGMGLGAETGYWFMNQRKLQHAVDVSAHAAGVRHRAGDTKAQIDDVARRIAIEAGFASGTLTVNLPPVSGNYAGDTESVEVLLEETHPRLFSSIFSDEPVRLPVRAVARVSGGSRGCVLALSPTAPGAVTVSGSTEVQLNGCDIASNSNASDAFLMSGTSAKLSVGCVFAVGEAETTSGLTLTTCPEVEEYAPTVRDPYASVIEPAVVGACQAKNVGSPSTTTTLTPSENHPSGVKSMRFCNGLDLKGNVSFGPGLYIIEGGDFTINNGDLSSIAGMSGSGVTFYLTGSARLKIGGNAKMSLSAPTEGPFAGILFFGSRSGSGLTHQVAGTSDSVLRGAVYAAASDLEFTGNSKTSDGCTQIIGDRVTFTGGSSLQSTCDNAGTKDIVTNQIVRVVE